MSKPLTAAVLAALLAGCASAPQKPAAPAKSYDYTANPYPSTYQRVASPPVLLQHATVLTGTGARLEDADVLLRDGLVVAVGSGLDAPADAVRVDATGRWVTPGIIDVHSHLGVYPSPGTASHSDGNEATAPVTAQVWAEHSIWPQDPGFHAARAGGVTAMQILPGSANLIGGRGVTLKNVPATTYQGMKFPGAP
ncbi:MAG TPA: amidohydrolase, partial [Thermomonas sp.]|nr:amidohydrolase [Thermomonas sp.]